MTRVPDWGEGRKIPARAQSVSEHEVSRAWSGKVFYSSDRSWLAPLALDYTQFLSRPRAVSLFLENPWGTTQSKRERDCEREVRAAHSRARALASFVFFAMDFRGKERLLAVYIVVSFCWALTHLEICSHNTKIHIKLPISWRSPLPI